MSLNEELGIPLVVTPVVRKSRNVIKTPRGDAGTHRSTCVKYHVDTLRYDGFSGHHYAYVVKILEEPEPTCFKKVVGKKNWEAAMDEEIAALDANHTWDLMTLPHNKKAIGYIR